MKNKILITYTFLIILFGFSNLFANTKIPSQIDLIIKGSQYKDLLKQYVILVKNNKNGLLNPKNIKQNIRGEVLWKDHDQIKKDLTKIKLTGDYFNDHFDLKRNIASLFIQLQNENIGSITKFKLFLPSARQYLNEIFITSFLESFGFIVPRTKIIKVRLNHDVEYFSIFQEHPSKELIERYKFKDGVILEGNEDAYYYNNYFKNDTNPLCCYPKIDNFSFLKNNYLNLKILLNASTKYTHQVHSIPEQSNYHYNFLDFNNSEYIEFDQILKFVDGEHALSINNRKFYYDAFYNRLIPIYYDGDVMLNFNFKNDKFLKNKKINNIVLDKDFKKNLLKNIKSKIHPEYLKKYDKKSDTFFSKIEVMLDKLIVRAERYNNSLIDKNYYDLNKPVSVGILAKDKNQDLNLINFKDNKYELCSVSYFFNLDLKCKAIDIKRANKIISNNKKHIMKFEDFPQIAGHLFGIQKQNKNDSLNSVKFNKHNTIFKKNKIVFSQKFLNNLKFIETYEGKIFLENGTTYVIKSKNKKNNIDLIFDYTKINKFSETFPRIVIIGNYNQIKIKTQNLNIEQPKTTALQSRYNDRQLTGCINLIDVNFETFFGDIKNMNCEDAINIVRSKGLINSLFIENSNSDALDIDYSSIKIELINIEQAKNDCVDISSGKYEIENIDLNNCGDKGVSVGERSNLKISKGIINLSNMGLASKDSSLVEVSNKLIIKNSFSCYEKYRKKQEFDVGNITFSDSGELVCNN